MAARIAVVLPCLAGVVFAQAQKQYDVIVYGATPAGCAAAYIAANNTGLKVALLEISARIGGMMVPGGIGLRDTDNFDSAFGDGSVARKWVDLNGAAYGVPYVLQPDVTVGNASLWQLLSSVHGMLDVYPNTALVEGGGAVSKTGAVITSITTVDTSSEDLDPVALLHNMARAGVHVMDVHQGESSRAHKPVQAGATTVWTAAQFIDASYDGDIVVAAGLSYTFGRESHAQYGEALAGVQPFNTFQNFASNAPVNPYDATGKVLPFIEEGNLPAEGSADTKLMPFSYRSCLTKEANNQLPFPQPPGYTSSDFEIVRRYVASFNASKFPKGPDLGDIVGVYTYGGPVAYPSTPTRAMRYDMCEGGSGTNGQTSPVTTDQPDINDGYVQGNRAGRAVVAARVYYWVSGLMWTLANDPSIPAYTRTDMSDWGLCKDAGAYWGPGAWPTQMYVREGVRMVSDYVATQLNVVKGECTPDAVASSAWTIDIHPVRRVAIPAGSPHYGGMPSAMNEGQVGFQSFPGNGSVWEVRYAIMTPKRAEASNLLVPVCASASHVVYGSIRVEPTFIAIGQAAGAAAVLAIQHGVAVQDVPVSELQAMQRANGVVPHYPPGRCTT